MPPKKTPAAKRRGKSSTLAPTNQPPASSPAAASLAPSNPIVSVSASSSGPSSSGPSLSGPSSSGPSSSGPASTGPSSSQHQGQNPALLLKPVSGVPRVTRSRAVSAGSQSSSFSASGPSPIQLTQATSVFHPPRLSPPPPVRSLRGLSRNPHLHSIPFTPQAIPGTPPLSMGSSFAGVGNPSTSARGGSGRKRRAPIRFGDGMPGGNYYVNRAQAQQGASIGTQTGQQDLPTELSEFLKRVAVRHNLGSQLTLLSFPATTVAVPISNIRGGPLDKVRLSMTFETSNTAITQGAGRETAAILTALQIIPLVRSTANESLSYMRPTNNTNNTNNTNHRAKRRRTGQTENEWARAWTVVVLVLVAFMGVLWYKFRADGEVEWRSLMKRGCNLLGS